MTKKFWRLGNVAQAYCLSPPFVIFTTIAGVFAGFLGAAWEKPICATSAWLIEVFAVWASTVPKLAKTIHDIAELFADEAGQTWSPPSVTLQAILFAIAVFTFGLCFGMTLWAQARSADKATFELKQATAQVSSKTSALNDETTRLAGQTGRLSVALRELNKQTDAISSQVTRLQTLPPKGFLHRYELSMRIIIAPWLELGKEADYDNEKFNAVLVSQLVNVLSIVKAFSAQDDTRYGCNIMIFRLKERLPDKLLDDLHEAMRFAPKYSHLKQYWGSLELLPELSASLDRHSEKGNCPDPEIPHLVLPVPQPQVDGKNREFAPPETLPGAPLAIINRRPTFMRGPLDRERFLANEEVPKEVRTKWDASFSSDKNIVSYMSFPIPDGGEPASGAWPLGVLNIHMDREDKEAEERIALLFPLLSPLLRSLEVVTRLYCARHDVILS